ncbi:pentapeptide repeat-containing protein [Romboutsia sp. 13368]|uniref:pentapeptide repeat-containing protein n=1 Tax=Romboutsia sp. 13368 TaxID=2708053 RepID=UPI0025E25966|nr:pentapeptide repeat-containing protein [Romboutsia sp. 13368]
MAYVNFKEEKFKGKIQIEKRKKNNEKLYQYIIKHKDSLNGIYPNLKYSFKKIIDEYIGKKGILGEENFKEIISEDIVCSKFIDCKFNNIKFKDCKFIGCVFENCNFDEGGVIFENCIFIKEDSEMLPSLNRKDNLGCSFYNCNIYAKFLNSDISYSIFENCKLKNTNIELTNASNVIMIGCEFDKVEIADCDFRGFKTFDTYMINFEFNDKFLTKFDEKTFFDKIEPRIKDKQEYEGIYEIYENIADEFKDNSLNNSFGEYYYLCKCTQRKSLKLLPKLGSYLNWITCGYGERPSFSIYSSLAIIVIFSFLYLITGIETDSRNILYTFNNIYLHGR